MISIWFFEDTARFHVAKWIDGIWIALWFFFMVPL